MILMKATRLHNSRVKNEYHVMFGEVSKGGVEITQVLQNIDYPAYITTTTITYVLFYP